MNKATLMEYSKLSTLWKKAIVFLLLPTLTITFLLFRFRSSKAEHAAVSSTASLDSFCHCYRNLTRAHHLVSIAGTSTYSSILISSAKNKRFLVSPVNSKPSIIVAAMTEPHVQAAVVCARTAGLGIRVRSGGHDYEGMSYSAVGIINSFVTVDVSGLRSISFETSRTAAWVQAGATLGELYCAVAKENNSAAFPAGFCPTVGVGGHISGGGMGSLTRKFGTAADNVVDARIVDAKGRLLDRGAMGEELFWAIRGAGGAGFGVILAFKVALVKVPPVVTVFNVVRTLKQNATKMVAQWQEVAPRMDPNLFIRLIAQAADESDGTRTIQVIFNSLYLGRRDELLVEANRIIPELGLTAAHCIEMSWLESVLFFIGDFRAKKTPAEVLLHRTAPQEYNNSFKAKSDFVQSPITESGWEDIWRFLMEASMNEKLVMIMEPFGGKMSEVSEDAIAFPHRKENLYNIQYFMKWPEEKDDAVTQRHLEWMRSLYEFMAPFVSRNPRAAYYNYKDIDLGRNAERTRSSYLAAKVWGTKYFKGQFKRLAKVKAMVDPDNFFWNEQSIPPYGSN